MCKVSRELTVLATHMTKLQSFSKQTSKHLQFGCRRDTSSHKSFASSCLIHGLEPQHENLQQFGKDYLVIGKSKRNDHRQMLHNDFFFSFNVARPHHSLSHIHRKRIWTPSLTHTRPHTLDTLSHSGHPPLHITALLSLSTRQSEDQKSL